MTEYKPQDTPFVKQLAANDRPTRDKAVASLRSFLGTSRKFSKLELLKLWRGLFFCMWLSDRPRPQQALAADLADLLTVLSAENAPTFLRAFWETIADEWANIDRLRMDKFLLLVRRYQGASFRVLERNAWDPALTEEFVQILEEVPVNATEKKITNGLRFHMVDIYVDELEKVVGGDEVDRDDVPFGLLLRPFEKLARDGQTKIVRNRAKEVLQDERLREWGYQAPAPPPKAAPAPAEWGGFDD